MKEIALKVSIQIKNTQAPSLYILTNQVDSSPPALSSVSLRNSAQKSKNVAAAFCFAKRERCLQLRS